MEKISENATARHLGWKKNQNSQKNKKSVKLRNQLHNRKKDRSKIIQNQLIDIFPT